MMTMAACLMCLATTGCYDRQELEQQAFVTALGIDKAPEGMLDCTLRFALPQNPASGGGSGGSVTPLAGKSPVTYRARSVTEALLIANSSIERQVSLTHLSSVIFGKTLAEEGLKPVLQAMVRYREFRPTVFVAIAHGTARDVLAQQKPMLDKSANRLADGIALTGQRTGLVPVVYLVDLQRYISGEQTGGVLPLFSINKNVQSSGGSGQGGGESQSSGDSQNQDLDQIKDGANVFRPGAVPRTGGDPVEWMGAAVFRQDRLVDEIDGRESIELQFLKGTMRSTKMDVPDPLVKNKYVGLTVRKERAPIYHVKLTNPMVIRVDVPLEADVINIESGVDYSRPDLQSKLERQVEHQAEQQYDALLTRLYHEDQADVVPIEDRVRGQFATDQQLRAYPWTERFRTARIEVHVTVSIRRYGVQLIPL